MKSDKPNKLPWRRHDWFKTGMRIESEGDYVFIDDALDEIEKLRAEIDKLNAVIAEAKSVIEFYGSYNSYYVNGAANLFNHIDDSDLERSGGLDENYNNIVETHGGKRAREFLAKLEQKT